MNRFSILALGMALVLALALAPAVLAADELPAEDPTPASEPTPTPDDGNGEIVIDPTFITETSAPEATPKGEVKAATGRPDRTPPATDTIAVETVPGTGLGALLLLAVAGCTLTLLLARAPATRRD